MRHVVVLAAGVILLGACGRPPAIEGVYADRSRVLSSTCGAVAVLDDTRATVRVDEAGAVVVTLLDVHFGGEPVSRRAVAIGDDVTVIEDTVSCGILAPSGPVVDAAVTGGVMETATTTTPSVVGPLREERLERVDGVADNTVRAVQTLRFRDTGVCAEGRLSTVPPTDCEVTRLIDLRLVEACPADCQQVQPVRGTDDAVFCACAADG